MKAVIFSCSLKNPKYSSTNAWSVLMAKRLALKGIESQIINLRDYDYESSTDKDELHEQLKYVYDASLIIFASPTNVRHPTFSCTNLVDRFVHAHKESKKHNIDIFKNKHWEYCEFQNKEYYAEADGKLSLKRYYTHTAQPHWSNHHGYMMKTLPFIDHLGLVDTHVSTYGPPNGLDGPNYDTMEDYDEVIQVCDNIVDTFQQKSFPTKNATPTCSLEKFLGFFRSDDNNAFGRGMTIADENINKEYVKKNIAHVHETVTNVSHKLVIFIMMRERCTRLGLLDLAEMYYIEQFTVIELAGPAIIKCSGNYRPIGY
jgi:hypothetical protein|tara:strand:+ start:258 stop:1202 length:945 start_codon:yes stop_codon:yes gene_type:complete